MYLDPPLEKMVLGRGERRGCEKEAGGGGWFGMISFTPSILKPSGVCDQFMFLKVTITELGVESTLEQILKMDPPYDVIVHLGSLMDGKLQQFKAVMSHTVELVHAGTT